MAGKAGKASKKAATRLADARARMYHDLIFESAEHVFGAKGFDGATMQQIAEEGGVSLKTLYVSYESKRDLFAQIMYDRASEFMAAMRAALAGEDDPLARVTRGVGAYAAFLFDHEDWLRIQLRTRIAWAFRPADEAAALQWRQGHQDFASVLSEGMEQGLFYAGDAEEMAILAQAIMQVQVARAVEHGGQDPAAVADAIMLQLRRLLCREGRP